MELLVYSIFYSTVGAIIGICVVILFSELLHRGNHRCKNCERLENELADVRHIATVLHNIVVQREYERYELPKIAMHEYEITRFQNKKVGGSEGESPRLSKEV